MTYTSEVLTDIYERSHSCLIKLMEHCRGLTSDELHREIEGFGYKSVRLQLQHEMEAERYWVGVLQGKMLLDEDETPVIPFETLEKLRRDVYDKTRDYLRGASIADLNTARPMMTWRGERTLVPAHIILRISVHLFHHQGQILAMCRLMGKPGEGFDYPIT